MQAYEYDPNRAHMSSIDGEGEMKAMADKSGYDRLEKDVETVKSELTQLSEQISEALNTLAGSAQKEGRRAYKQARSNVDSVMSDMSKQGDAALSAARDAAETLEETIEDAIHERPLAAVGIAIALGLLIGITWRR